MKKVFVFLLFVLIACIPSSYSEDSSPGAGKIRSWLDKIQIQKMEFNDAPVDKVLSEIYKAVVAVDTTKKGLNMAMILNPDQKGKLPVITMKFEEGSLYSVLQKFCKLAGLTLRIEDDLLYFYPTGELPHPFYMETRIYPVEKESFTELGASNEGPTAGAETDGGASSGEDLLEQYFISRGIPFPPGAKTVFDSRISRLIATNTPDNLDKIEEIIHELNVVDPQVGIGVKYLKITESDFRKVVGEDMALNPRQINSSLYSKLMESGKIQVVADSYILTQNGQEATVRMVSEKFFPIRWTESNLVDENREKAAAGTEKDDKEKGKSHVTYSTTPEFGGQTELGVRLTVTPTVDADRYTISLDMTPMIQSHIGWTDYDLGETKAKMPDFAVSTAETKMVIYDGSSVLLESSLKDEAVDGTDKTVSVRHFIFVMVKLINPDGKLLRNGDVPARTVVKKKAWALYENIKDFDKVDSSVVQKLSGKIDFEAINLTPDKVFEALAPKMKASGLTLRKDFQEPWKKTFITMFIKDMALGEVLRILAICTDSGISIEGNEIRFNQPEMKMETKSIRVRAALIAAGYPGGVYDFDGRVQKFESNPAAESNQGLMDYFSQRGISFPKGSGIIYERRAGVLLIRNTTENVRRLEALLRDLDIETPLVHIQFDMIEMKYDELEKIMSENKTSEFAGTAFYHLLLKSGKAKINSQRIVATSGQPALGRQVLEKYFPTSWTEPAFAFEKDSTVYTPSYAELGEATDLGQRLEATVTVSPNNYTTSLNLHPLTREQIGWSEYPYEVILNKVSDKVVLEKNKLIMPEFALRDISTNVKCYDGETILVGKTYLGFDPEKESFFNYRTAKYDGKVILFFITPVLVNPDGNPVRK
ncbi:MAG TPA: hypothetical protein DET40_22950 [Lentisphaeria bacterium]|nr:MAG: hypothetical protein A2X45_15835 [Lentisphaerae bacterium GWF2_50_93]HCE46413.1 hypothetical protein [Lentisphaeria bacterium]